MFSLNVMELEYTDPVIHTTYMESLVDSMFNGFTCYQETIERRNTGYHVDIHDLYKYLIDDDRMKALDLNEQVFETQDNNNACG